MLEQLADNNASIRVVSHVDRQAALLSRIHWCKGRAFHGLLSQVRWSAERFADQDFRDLRSFHVHAGLACTLRQRDVDSILSQHPLDMERGDLLFTQYHK